VKPGPPPVVGLRRRFAFKLLTGLAGLAGLTGLTGVFLASDLLAQPAPGAMLQVGPTRAITSLAEASRRVRDGDTIEVDAGTYRGDVAVWQRDGLTLRAVGGRVRLLAEGAAAEGKAIWVMRGGQVLVEGFDFEGTRVAARNGAGIRFETGRLTVRDCRFVDNEMGLLTNNDPQAELTVENSEFARNQRPDGHNHNLYVGSIGRLIVTGSHLHHASTGHLLKSRAAINYIAHNRLVDGPQGSASYELEFPNGGVAVVLNNLIQQNARTQNTIMISYGAEGYRWPANTLVLARNTLVDDLPQGGIALRVMPGDVTLKLFDNLLVGGSGPLLATPAGPADDVRDNRRVERDAYEQGLPPAGVLPPTAAPPSGVHR